MTKLAEAEREQTREALGKARRRLRYLRARGQSK